jgi:hypothetical protein
MKIPFTLLTCPTSEYCDIDICHLKQLIDSIKQIDNAKYNKDTKRWSFPKIFSTTFEKNVHSFASRVNYDVVSGSKDISMVEEDKENVDTQKYMIQIRHENGLINVNVNPFNRSIIDFFKTIKNRRFNPETKEWILSNDASMIIKNYFHGYNNIQIKEL